MELDVSLDKDSLSIPLEDPFHLDMDSLVAEIEGFCSAKNASLKELDLMGLIPKMIRGIAGCENGCPADAKSLVSRGVKDFELKYVEGGILTARTVLKDGRPLQLKMFPDF